MSAAIVAFGAVSALGEGQAAVSAGSPGERAPVSVRLDPELANAGLLRPYAARARLAGEEAETRDRATAMLVRAAVACVQDLDVAIPSWRTLRVGLALGTSSGGMRTAETVFTSYLRADAGPVATGHDAASERARNASTFYFSPMAEMVTTLAFDFQPATLVMGACAASAVAIGLGLRWLDAGVCDLVLAGGFDAVSTLVASGFEALRATTASAPPRPFRAGRDGMALGEGAALVALRLSERAAPARALAHVIGFGVSSDAVHLTAPDRTGAGLARAAKAALAEAGLTRVDLLSPHGTATPFSDAAEAKAIATALPESARQVIVHPFKAQVGHTLGAAGVLEALTCVDALRRGVYPAAAGEGPIDPETPVNLLDVARAGSPETALKLSAAFGGLNAALVLSRDARPRGAAAAAMGRVQARPSRPIYLRAALHVATPPASADLAARIGFPIERVIRADALTRFTLAAVAGLVARDGPLTGAGILVGCAFATLETDASFHARIFERGVRFAEPRKFPYTSPNAAAGDATVAFGLTGPSFAVGAGMHAALEAVAVAFDLIRARDAETLVVVAVDDVGPVVARIAESVGLSARSGAVALVLSADPKLAVARVDSAATGMGRGRPHGRVVCGHEVLLPLLSSPRPAVLEAASPDPRSFAREGPANPSRGAHEGGASAWARVELSPV